MKHSYHSVEKSYNISLLLFFSTSDIIQPNRYKITLSLRTHAESITDVNKAYHISNDIIEYFVNAILHNSIITDIDNIALAETICPPYENNLLVLPSAIDFYICACLYYKFNTIIDKISTIESLRLTNLGSKTTHTMDINEAHVVLPDQHTWLGEFPFWKTPWWERNDCSTYDNFCDNSSTYTKWCKYAKEEKIAEYTTAPLKKIRKRIINEFSGKSNKPAKTDTEGELILVDFAKTEPKWQPKIV